MTTTMQPKQSCSLGDVVLVLFAHSDLQTAKARPAIVVQADHLDSGLSQVIVAMVSGRLFRAGHPSRVVLRIDTATGRGSGLLADSVVMTDNLATVALAAIDRVIGTLPMHEVDAALRHTLGM